MTFTNTKVVTLSGTIILYVKHSTVINIDKSVNYFKQKYEISCIGLWDLRTGCIGLLTLTRILVRLSVSPIVRCIVKCDRVGLGLTVRSIISPKSDNPMHYKM